MKTTQEFQSFYYNNLLNDLAQLENERKKLSFWIFFIFACVLLACLFILGIFARGQNLQFPIGLLFLFITGIAVYSVWKFIVKGLSLSFILRFKKDIIAKIILFIEPGLNYNPFSHVSWVDFQRSDIFRDRVDRYTGEDVVYGNVGATEMRFSEVNAEKKIESSGKNKQERWQTVFRGILLIADFHKDFKGKTFIFPDLAEKMLGSLGNWFQSLRLNRGQLVKLEDIEFEKTFVVFGSDQVEARYILSPSLMERLLDYQKKVGSTVYFSFVNSCIFIAIPNKRNLFEPNIMKNLTDYGFILTIFNDLCLLIGTVEELNLNTRIWAKQP